MDGPWMKRPDAIEKPDLLTLRAVAARLAVSSRTVERMVGAGTFPQPIRMNSRCLRWSRETVDRWLDERAGGAPAGGQGGTKVSLRLVREA